jgi:hypothetical protein
MLRSKRIFQTTSKLLNQRFVHQMESDFTLAQHKEFLDQLRRGESIYVRVEA